MIMTIDENTDEYYRQEDKSSNFHFEYYILGHLWIKVEYLSFGGH